MTETLAAPGLLTYLGFFLTGMAVNLTPCVYPMLTVTISLFKPEFSKKETLQHSFFKALAYFFGIAVMYSALGYFAASSGKLFGSILQNSWVLGVVGGMMLVLSLSMFGLFKLRPSAELLSKLALLRRADYVGLFISGMLVGVFAAPCIGPPVIALLGAVAQRGDPQFGLTAFFIFSCGLGLPYLLLGTFENLTTRLPKAGAWLIWVERAFAVVLLAFAVFYLSLAFKINPEMKTNSSIWKPYRVGEVVTSVGAHKPIVVDFYADWCLSCHEFEAEVLSKPDVAAALEKLTTLRVDATNQDDPNVVSILEQHDIVGLPTIIFLDAQGDELRQLRMEGAGTKKKFLARIAAQAEHFKKDAP
jgi:thiol:disulfide interchange protein DsbD